MTNLFYIGRSLVFFFATIMLLKYFIFMVLAPFYPVKESLRKLKVLKRAQKEGYDKVYRPLTISVIIPAWNEEVGIMKTIQSVLNNSYSHVEIIVVNDGSKDKTGNIVMDFINKHTKDGYIEGKMLRYFYKQNGGKGRALNLGIRKATGDIILTMDADSAISSHGLERLVIYFQDSDINAVVGNVKVSDTDSIIGLIQRLEYLFGFYFKRAHAVMGAEYIFGGACAAFRKELFETIGLFDEKNKTEDIEMSMRIRSHGYRCTYAEDVICYTEGASTIQGLVNQRLRWKKGRFDTFLRYRAMFLSTHPDHNKALTFFILPFSQLQELQLFFEPFGITLLVAYSYISGDFLSLTLGIMFIFVVYLINALFHHEGMNLKLLFIFPFSWILFYFLVWIEYLALLHSLKMLLRGDNVQWQAWQRKGVKELSV